LRGLVFGLHRSGLSTHRCCLSREFRSQLFLAAFIVRNLIFVSCDGIGRASMLVRNSSVCPDFALRPHMS
jgi:hypothetical protein